MIPWILGGSDADHHQRMCDFNTHCTSTKIVTSQKAHTKSTATAMGGNPEGHPPTL